MLSEEAAQVVKMALEKVSLERLSCRPFLKSGATSSYSQSIKEMMKGKKEHLYRP